MFLVHGLGLDHFCPWICPKKIGSQPRLFFETLALAAKVLSLTPPLQNTAATLVLCIRKYTHITSVLMKLHWLPVQHRVKFKFLTQVFKILNGQSPSYRIDLISTNVPTCALRSSESNLLVVPRSSWKFGDCRFSVSGPR